MTKATPFRRIPAAALIIIQFTEDPRFAANR